MIGMVLVTHRGIAAELLTALNDIVGPQMQAKAIGIGPQDDMEKCRDAILTAIKEVNTGKGVVIAHRYVRRHAQQPCDRRDAAHAMPWCWQA